MWHKQISILCLIAFAAFQAQALGELHQLKYLLLRTAHVYDLIKSIPLKWF